MEPGKQLKGGAMPGGICKLEPNAFFLARVANSLITASTNLVLMLSLILGKAAN